MASDEQAFHWRREDTYITLSGDAFAKLVHENGLEVKGPFGEFFYAMKHTIEGEELYRTAAGNKGMWTYRQVCTQDNVAGGTLQVDITPATDTVMRLIAARMIASGNRAANWFLLEGGGTATYALLQATTAAAGAVCSIPATAVTSTTTGSATDSMGLVQIGIGQDGKLVANVVSAAQTETATVELMMLIEGTQTKPTVSWTNSAGTPNVSAAAKDELRSVGV